MKPLAIDLFCGLGGWSEGCLAEGFDVVGFDIERHQYGDQAYPAQLVLQDVLTIHGKQFAKADLIVSSPPCQGYSYRAMPWKRAKALPPPDNSLFEACFRIQQEACQASGRYIPLVVENVRGAQKWVGRARFHFGSFYLWGDVPALMPMAKSIKNNGGSWFNIGSPGQTVTNQNPVHGAVKVATQRVCDCGHGEDDHGFNPDLGIGSASWHDKDNLHPNDPRNFWSTEGTKQHGSGREWFAGEGRISRVTSSKSSARKAASAMIAKIPLVLSRHIAQSWKPEAIAS